jgi:hypothetical protein
VGLKRSVGKLGVDRNGSLQSTNKSQQSQLAGRFPAIKHLSSQRPPWNFPESCKDDKTSNLATDHHPIRFLKHVKRSKRIVKAVFLCSGVCFYSLSDPVYRSIVRTCCLRHVTLHFSADSLLKQFNEYEPLLHDL